MRRKLLSVVISNMFYSHPYLGKIPILTHIFHMGWNHQLVNDVSKIPDVNVNVCKLRVPCTSVISASYSHNTMVFPGKTIVLEGTHFSRCFVVTTYPSQIDLCLCITITILSNFVKGQIFQILQSFQMQHLFFHSRTMSYTIASKKRFTKNLGLIMTAKSLGFLVFCGWVGCRMSVLGWMTCQKMLTYWWKKLSFSIGGPFFSQLQSGRLLCGKCVLSVWVFIWMIRNTSIFCSLNDH